MAAHVLECGDDLELDHPRRPCEMIEDQPSTEISAARMKDHPVHRIGRDPGEGRVVVFVLPLERVRHAHRHRSTGAAESERGRGLKVVDHEVSWTTDDAMGGRDLHVRCDSRGGEIVVHPREVLAERAVVVQLHLCEREEVALGDALRLRAADLVGTDPVVEAAAVEVVVGGAVNVVGPGETERAIGDPEVLISGKVGPSRHVSVGASHDQEVVHVVRVGLGGREVDGGSDARDCPQRFQVVSLR